MYFQILLIHPLLNIESFYLNLCGNLITNCKHMKKNQSHITQMFLPGKHKAKNPTIIYYVYIMVHETISYKNIIQELLVQYTIVSHCHTKIGINMHQFTASWQPASTAQSLLMKIPEWIWSCLALNAKSSLACPMCVKLHWMHHYSHSW